MTGNIKRLIHLDYYVIKQMHIRLFILIAVTLSLSAFSNPSSVILGSMVGLIFVLNLIFESTNRSHFDKLYGILPIKKSEIVTARYAICVLYLIAMAVITTTLFCVMSLIWYQEISWFLGISVLSISNILCAFYISLQFPIYFRFEYPKAAAIAMVPFLLSFTFGSFLIGDLLEIPSFQASLSRFLTFVASNILLMLLASIILSIFMLALSCCISIAIYKKRK